MDVVEGIQVPATRLLLRLDFWRLFSRRSSTRCLSHGICFHRSIPCSPHPPLLFLMFPSWNRVMECWTLHSFDPIWTKLDRLSLSFLLRSTWRTLLSFPIHYSRCMCNLSFQNCRYYTSNPKCFNITIYSSMKLSIDHYLLSTLETDFSLLSVWLFGGLSHVLVDSCSISFLWLLPFVLFLFGDVSAYNSFISPHLKYSLHNYDCIHLLLFGDG